MLIFRITYQFYNQKFNAIIEKIKIALLGSKERKYPDSYYEELIYQSHRILPMLSITSVFIWIPYLYVDHSNYPLDYRFSLIRLGLTLFGSIVLVISLKIKSSVYSMYLGLFLVSYLILGSLAVAVFSNFNPAYCGGFYLTSIMVITIGPIPLFFSYPLVAISQLIFLIYFNLFGNDPSPSQVYSLQDFYSTIFLTYFFGYIQNHIRYNNYFRAKEIETKNIELLVQKDLINEKQRQTDKLLHNILPARIVDELNQYGSITPTKIQSASVMFTDFVGFTKVSEKFSPEELVEQLDQYFSYFDQVCVKYNLEKIKTMGDSFLCAGGLPEPNRTHAIDCCLAAIEMINLMSRIKEIKEMQGLEYWNMRIGIHTGPLVAGVVGTKKFAYDIWGDTVNTANRMESSGREGRINISESTYQLVKYFFNCEYRNKIEAKNKGYLDMYFLNGLKSKFSKDQECRIPNDSMRQLLDEIKSGKKLQWKKETLSI